MLYFLDTSVLVKRYHEETGSKIILELFQTPENFILISSFTITETLRTFDRLHQTNIIKREQFLLAAAKLYQDIETERIGVTDITRQHIDRANQLVLEYHLNAPDAIILSCALEFKPESPIFVCADTRSGLLRAAESSALSTLNPLT